MSLKELADSVTKNETKKWEPPNPGLKKDLTLKWEDKQWVAPLRLMTPNDKLTRDRICAGFIGIRVGANAETFPNYRYWYALATVRTLWNDLPDWLDWLVSNHPTLPIEILEQVELFEDSFREAAGLFGLGETSGPVLSIS